MLLSLPDAHGGRPGPPGAAVDQRNKPCMTNGMRTNQLDALGNDKPQTLANKNKPATFRRHLPQKKTTTQTIASARAECSHGFCRRRPTHGQLQSYFLEIRIFCYFNLFRKIRPFQGVFYSQDLELKRRRERQGKRCNDNIKRKKKRRTRRQQGARRCKKRRFNGNCPRGGID